MYYRSIFLILFLSFCIHGNAMKMFLPDYNLELSSTYNIPIAKDNYGFKFRYLTSANGFAGNAVFQTIQDQKGTIWFATWYGLYKYNGSLLLPVYHTESAREKLGSTITKILEDSQHRIWAATVNGLVIWNPVYERIDSLDFSSISSDNIPAKVRTFCKDDRQNIWIGGRGLLCKYNSKTSKITDYSSLLNDRRINISELYIDKDHQLWVITSAHRLMKLESGDSYEYPDDSTGMCKLVADNTFDSQEKHRGVLSMYQDSLKNYWFSTTDGIFYMRKKLDKSNEIEVIHFDRETESKEKISVRAFTQRGDEILAATPQGLFCYSLKSHTSLLINQNDNTPEGLNSNSLYDVFVDRENGMWIASFSGGVNYSSPIYRSFNYHWLTDNQMKGKVVTAFAEDDNHNLWIGTERNGLFLWNRQTSQLQNFTDKSKTPFNLISNNVQRLLFDDGKLFITTFNGGLDVVDVTTLTRTAFPRRKTHPDIMPRSIAAMLPKDEENIWLGSWQGLYTVNFVTGESHRSNYFEKVNSMDKDESGNLWLCNVDKGLYKYSLDKNEITHIISTEQDSSSIKKLYSLVINGEYIYMGTKEGHLWRYHLSTGKAELLFSAASTNTFLSTILVDEDVVWIASNKGLYSYNQQTGEVSHFDVDDGLSSIFFKKSAGIKTSEGVIILGSVNGKNSFKTSEVKSKTYVPQVILSDISISGTPVCISAEHAYLTQALPYASSLKIGESANDICFTFVSSSYCNSANNKFEYKLEPGADNWNVAEGGKISFHHLSAGDYVLRFRTSNGSQQWSKEGVMAITVVPFWWKSAPMKCLYILLFIGIIFLYVRKLHLKKQREIRLLRYEKEKEIYQAKMDFFTYMVHEVRTPLTLIMGPLSRLMKSNETLADVKSDLELMDRNAQRLLLMVNQLMDFRKIEEKSFNVNIGAVDLKDLIETTLKDFFINNESDKIKLELIVKEKLCWALIDREAFTKVLMNLISNAYKFTNDYIGIEVNLSDDRNFWKVSIKDNGVGIPVESQSLIFNSFYQVPHDQKYNYTGTGIGLFVVRRLLELQNGSIKVISEPGEGATFIAEVPIAEAPQTIEPLEPSHQNATSSNVEIDSQKDDNKLTKRLLIVEDNLDMCKYIASTFPEGFQIDQCANGKEALDKIVEKEYDLIITDLMMPVMDGLTLCKILKSKIDTSHIPVIVLTAKADNVSHKESLELNADAFITKPFVPEILLLQVKSILHNRDILHEKISKEPYTSIDELCTSPMDKNFMKQINQYILTHIADTSLDIDSLMFVVNMSRSLFFQKMKKLTGMTPNDYIRLVRLKKAVELFEDGEDRISEVCFQVGFSSPSYFAKRFQQQFGYSPSDFLKKLKSGKLK